MVLINLFDKGKGLEYLKNVYHLSDQEVNKVKESLYEYCEPEQMSEESADAIMESMFSWLSDEEKQSTKEGIMAPVLPHWQVVDFPVEKFLEITHVKLDDSPLSDLRFYCIHVSPAIDGGESIKQNGLRKLTDLLEVKSPIKSFLAEYGIEVSPSERWYSIHGKKYSITGTELEIKLFYTNSEIEAFIAGDYENLKDYSCIESNPEFLRELSPLCGIDLQTEWEKRKNALLYVSFDVSFDECSNITEMSEIQCQERYQSLLPFLNQSYEYGKEPISIWRNYWFIYACINNSCPGAWVARSPMAVKESVVLDSRRIKTWTINHVISNISKRSAKSKTLWSE